MVTTGTSTFHQVVTLLMAMTQRMAMKFKATTSASSTSELAVPIGVSRPLASRKCPMPRKPDCGSRVFM